MKAAVLYEGGVLRYEESYPEPATGPRQVKIRVRCSGICGSDVPRVLNNAAHHYPVVLGHEFSGDIVEVGADVSGVRIGSKAAGAPLLPCLICADCMRGDYSLCGGYSFIGSREQGSFAEHVVLPAINAVVFDDAVSYEQGALFEPATVALHGLRRVCYVGGRDVAVLGGGTIGLFTMQWAKIFGAKSVTVFDVAEHRLVLAKKLGSDYTVNTSAIGLPAILHPEAFDYVFEAAGQTETMLQAFSLAAKKASVCFIGTPTKELTFSHKQLELMHRKEFTLTGAWMSYSAPFPGDEWRLTSHYFGTGQLKFDAGMIFKTFPLCDAAEAFQLFKTPGAVGGKMLLTNSAT